MSDQTQPKQAPETSTTEISPIAKAEAILKRIEEENRRAEDILSRSLLSGKSIAGQAPEKAKEESPQEYRDRILRGQI